MDDRTLLELAAKAAGLINARYHEATGGDYDCGTCILHDTDNGRSTHAWNPLLRDDQALRLAVKLSLHFVEISLSAVATVKVPICIEVWRTEDEDPIYTHYAQTGDKYEATRRAIVRAAAEISRGLGGAE